VHQLFSFLRRRSKAIKWSLLDKVKNKKKRVQGKRIEISFEDDKFNNFSINFKTITYLVTFEEFPC